jgi:regulator of sigma E protease
MLNIAVMLSANLGVMNLLPLPALDGGRLLFFIIEVFRRRKMKDEIEGAIHTIGFMLLMALMVFVMINDIIKLF